MRRYKVVIGRTLRARDSAQSADRSQEWNPGWFSAPHSYATDRIQMVMSGTWWVNSGADFTPDMAVPVPAGRLCQANCTDLPL
jgi:hypothetical protein